MARETIAFSEERIPEVVEIIRAGIRATYLGAGCPDERREAARALESQCAELLEYWDRLQQPGDGE